MVEVAPKSLFGKEAYVREQIHINEAYKQVEQAIMLVTPFTFPYSVPSPILKRIPIGYRFRKIRKHLGEAKRQLEAIGV